MILYRLPRKAKKRRRHSEETEGRPEQELDGNAKSELESKQATQFLDGRERNELEDLDWLPELGSSSCPARSSTARSDPQTTRQYE